MWFSTLLLSRTLPPAHSAKVATELSASLFYITCGPPTWLWVAGAEKLHLISGMFADIVDEILTFVLLLEPACLAGKPQPHGNTLINRNGLIKM